MTRTQQPTDTGKARREYNATITSLANAEQLREILGQAQRDLADDNCGSNAYLDDAFRHACELVAEMEAELQYVMDTYTPEECGL